MRPLIARVSLVLASLCLLLGTAFIHVPATSAAFGSCAPFTQAHINWANQNRFNNSVHFKLVSNGPNGLVGYTDGVLYFDNGTLAGTGTQYFNDRLSDDHSGGFSFPTYPFDPQRTDKLGVQVKANGTVTLTLLSWGGGQISIPQTLCDQGVLFGTGAGTDSTFMLSLQDVYNPPIK